MCKVLLRNFDPSSIDLVTSDFDINLMINLIVGPTFSLSSYLDLFSRHLSHLALQCLAIPFPWTTIGPLILNWKFTTTFHSTTTTHAIIRNCVDCRPASKVWAHVLWSGGSKIIAKLPTVNVRIQIRLSFCKCLHIVRCMVKSD